MSRVLILVHPQGRGVRFETGRVLLGNAVNKDEINDAHNENPYKTEFMF